MLCPELFSPEFHRDPYPTYRWLRAHSPVHPVTLPNGTSAWLVTRYEDVRAVLADPTLSKNQHRYLAQSSQDAQAAWMAQLPTVQDVLSGHMINSDPPDHTRLRTLVTKVFTPRRVEALRPLIQQITDELLDGMDQRQGEHRRADLVSEFAFPLPMRVISAVLGVPEADRESFRAWGVAVTSGFGQGGSRFVSAAVELKEYLHGLLAVKRADPGDDLLSQLITVRDGDNRLSESELVAMVFLLMMTGQETSVHLITAAVHHLTDHPDQLARLRADPTLLPAALEEILRFDGPVKTTSLRFATAPMTLHGVHIPEGGILITAPQAANRDPDRFADPDQLDITRSDNPHLAFGHGPHFCVAASLGRLEAQIAIRTLLDRFPALTVTAAPEDVTWIPGILVRGLQELPIRY